MNHSHRSNFSRQLLRWYDASRRDLPWRSSLPDAYHILVSELMLQQTQVVTVIPYFHRFLQAFPTLRHLADADEQEVLKLWQGLGYYSRARNLRAAALKVMNDFNGDLPQSIDALLTLPGVGRYTAGAVASIAFGKRVPILDGNVQRVLCRLDRIESDPRDRETQKQLWHRAEEILPKTRVGDFNSALMELGATICTPRAPTCLLCPVREHCRALAGGVVDKIPLSRKSRVTPLVRRRTYCIHYADQWLIEQRPSTGRWAKMWQFPTIDADSDASQLQLSFSITPLKSIGTVTHTLTHRRYLFDIVTCDVADETLPVVSSRRWTRLAGLNDFPLPKPQLKIAEMLDRRSKAR